MNILTTATAVASWMAYVGLACGALYAFGGLIYDLLTIGLNWGTALAFMALVGMPLVFATFGFLAGALVAVGAAGVKAVLDRMGPRRQA